MYYCLTKSVIMFKNYLFLNNKPKFDFSCNTEILFVVTSTIRPPQIPLSYCKVRSVYSSEERYLQTLSTIKSININAPGSTIILLENSFLSNDERLAISNMNVQIASFCDDKEAVKWRDSIYKGAGELYMLINAIKLLKNTYYSKMFKISGRYRLTQNFDHRRFSSDKFGFIERDGSCSTRLYSVPKSLEKIYEQQLKKTFKKAKKGVSIETIIMSGISSNVLELLPYVGVSGEIAVNGDPIIE